MLDNRTYHVIRGGSFDEPGDDLRSSLRIFGVLSGVPVGNPDYMGAYLGFRCAMSE